MMRQRLGWTIRRPRGYAAIGGACMGAMLVASVAGGQACPCAQRDLATIVKQADVIFAGKPLAATTDSATMGRQPNVEYQARFTFDVGAVLKGRTPRATTVVTPSGPCGFGFAVGGDYLVIGKKQGEVIVTDACQGNAVGVDAIRARTAAIRAALAPAASPPGPTAAH